MKEGTQRSLPFIAGRHPWLTIGVIVLLWVVGVWLHPLIEDVSSRGKYEIVMTADGNKTYILDTCQGHVWVVTQSGVSSQGYCR